jgi:hypothetical protein
MKSTVEFIKTGIAESEKELKELDRKREALLTRIKEMKHDIILLGGSETPAAKPPKPSGKFADKGEKVGSVQGEKGGDFPIYKNVRVLLLSEITGKIPANEWFKPGLVHSAIARFYPHSVINKYLRYYLKFLERLKFIEHNGKSGHSSRYRWTPKFQDKPLSEEEVKRRAEEDRKALQDVLG